MSAGQVIKLDNKEAFEVHRRIMAYESAEYKAYLADCKENRDFFYNQQYTQDEIDAQKARGQYVLVVNKIRKAINGIVGLLSASQPKFKVVPAGNEDNEMANLGTKLLDWVWHNSGGLQAFRRVVKMGARDNIGYFHVIFSSDRKVRFIPLGFDDVLVDPKSRDPLMCDADAIYIYRWMTVEKVKALYGVDNVMFEVPAQLASLYSEGGIGAVTKDRLFSADKMYVKVYEGYRKQVIRHEDTTVSTRVIKETLLGYQHVYREEMPPEIVDIPIIPVYAEDTDNAYKYGEVAFLKGLQRFINKSYGVTILNAQLMSNPKVIIREADLAGQDKQEFEDNYAKPGSVTVLSNMAQGEPVVIQGQPLNSAFFTLYQDAKMELEAATLPREVLGYMDSSQQHYQRPSLLDVREAVLDSMKGFAGNVEAALSHLGTVALQFCRAYLRGPETLRIVDGEKRMERLMVNQQQGLDPNNPQSIQAFAQNMQRQGAAPEEIDAIISEAQSDAAFSQNLSFLMNSVDALEVDVFVVPGSYAPSFEMASLRLAMELQERGVVDNEAVLEHAPVENKQEILQRISVVRQQASYIEQLEEDLKRAETEAQQLRSKLADDGVRGVIESEKVRQDSVYKDLRAKAYVEKARQKLETREVIRQAEHEAQELLDDIRRQAEQKNENTGADENDLALMALMSDIIQE